MYVSFLCISVMVTAQTMRSNRGDQLPVLLEIFISLGRSCSGSVHQSSRDREDQVAGRWRSWSYR